MLAYDSACESGGEVEVKLRARGFARILAFDADGNLLGERRSSNMVTDAGRTQIMKLISAGQGGTAISHGGVGTGSGATATNTTALVSETGTRKAVSYGLTGGTADYTWSYATSEVNASLQEVGLFNSSSSGTLFARAPHSAINKDNTMTLAYTYELQLQTAP